MGWALFGLVLVVLVFGIFAAVLASFLKSNKEVQALERGIVTGAIPGLMEWSPTLASSLSSDGVGTSHYFRPMGGARTTKLAATILSASGPGVVLAISASTTSRGEGHILAIAQGLRLESFLRGRVWMVQANGRPLGTIDGNGGRLDDPGGNRIGWMRRGSDATQIHLRGADVAWLAPEPKLHEARPATVRPMVRWITPSLDQETALWILAVASFDFATSTAIGGASPMGVP